MIKLTAGVITNKRLPANTNFDRHPDECPFCHKGVQPFLFGGFLHNNLCKLWLFYACPRADCERHFIGEYSQAIASDGVIYHFEKTLLGNYGKMDFSEDINKLSPDFSRIYNQARQGEFHGLTDIVGPGYRKSLEFLIKDYLISKTPSQSETIKRILLGECISKHIQNEKIKALAARAAWLGNDETHYTRKWEKKDINDLKQLIDLTAHWIDYELVSERIIGEMPTGR